jgi:hypothetical protein
MNLALRAVVPVASAVTLAACVSAGTTVPVVFGDGGDELRVEGIAPCTPEQPARIDLDPEKPLVLIVHGCFSSGGQFKQLSEVFRLHGQQTLCFNYDDRNSLRGTALRLRRAIDELGRRMVGQEIVVLGHSQGGLISRIALSNIEPEAPDPGTQHRLVTVSSPFSGIDAAEHCGWTWLHIVSLGITTGICQAIAGAKWTEIHPGDSLWDEPDPLQASVADHLQIVTDEEGTCRERDEDGECDEDDFVFSLSEQTNPLLLEDDRVSSTTVGAGHVEIVGENGIQPRKLIEILQQRQILNPTPPEMTEALQALLQRIF